MILVHKYGGIFWNMTILFSAEAYSCSTTASHLQDKDQKLRAEHTARKSVVKYVGVFLFAFNENRLIKL